MRLASRKRSAFTLIEVILASAIALVLMAGLYVAMDVELSRTQAGRELVERSTLVRAVLNKVTGDLEASLTQISQKTNVDPLLGEILTPELQALSQVVGTNVAFQSGVVGGSASITIYMTKVPEAVNQMSDDPTEINTTTDLRKVTYYVSGTGLVREESLWLTAESSDSLMGGDETEPFVIAPEVTNLAFRYWDGASWLESWDGSQPGPDGMTPLGPPRAIELTMSIVIPGDRVNGEFPTKTIRHVIAVPAAAGPAIAGQAAQGAMP